MMIRANTIATQTATKHIFMTNCRNAQKTQKKTNHSIGSCAVDLERYSPENNEKKRQEEEKWFAQNKAKVNDVTKRSL